MPKSCNAERPRPHQLQPMTARGATPPELAAISDDSRSTPKGRVIEERHKYATASRVFANAKDAEAGGAYTSTFPATAT